MANYKLIATALLTIGSVVGVREYLKPRDIQSLLKWKGITLIDTKNDNAWKASLHENEEALKTIGIENYEKLRDWCASQMKQGITDQLASDAEKYCQDKPATVMGHIIRDGEKEKLIGESDKDAFKIVYVLSKDRDKLLELISIDKSKKNDYEDIGAEINKWCTKEFNRKVKDPDHLGNVKRYCYDRKVKTIKDLLEKENFQLLPEKEYKERFEGELIKAAELLSQMIPVLKTKLNEKAQELNQVSEDKIDEKFIKDSEHRVKFFQWYCEAKYKEDLTGGSIFPEVYQRVKSRCTVRKS